MPINQPLQDDAKYPSKVLEVLSNLYFNLVPPTKGNDPSKLLKEAENSIQAELRQKQQALLGRLVEMGPQFWKDNLLHLNNEVRAFTAREHQLDDIELANEVINEWRKAIKALKESL